MLSRKSTCTSALLQSDVNALVQHLLKHMLPNLQLTRSTQLCLLLLLCSLHDEEDTRPLVCFSFLFTA